MVFVWHFLAIFIYLIWQVLASFEARFGNLYKIYLATLPGIHVSPALGSPKQISVFYSGIIVCLVMCHSFLVSLVLPLGNRSFDLIGPCH